MSEKVARQRTIQPRHIFMALMYAGMLYAFSYIINEYIDQLGSIVQIMSQATWYGLGLAIILIIAALGVQAHLFQRLYNLFDLPTKLSRIWSLYLITRFVNVAIPSGGLAGMAPFIQDARKRKLPQGKIIIINLTYIILWYSAFALFLTIGLIELFIIGELAWFEVGAGVTLFVMTILLVIGLVTAGFAPLRLKKVIGSVFDVYGRITKRPTRFIRQKSDTFINELNTAFITLKNAERHEWVYLFGFALLNEILYLSVLFVVSWTFKQPFQYGTLVAAYSISILFFILSPTPGGLGYVEGILLLVLGAVGHSEEGAVVIMLAYRGITFWLPFLLGFAVTLTSRGKGVP